jgi:hypothetical protein
MVACQYLIVNNNASLVGTTELSAVVITVPSALHQESSDMQVLH